MQLLFSLCSWEIHIEQGQYYIWYLLFSSEVPTREGFVSRFASKCWGSPKYRKAELYWRQSCINEKGLCIQ